MERLTQAALELRRVKNRLALRSLAKPFLRIKIDLETPLKAKNRLSINQVRKGENLFSLMRSTKT